MSPIVNSLPTDLLTSRPAFLRYQGDGRLAAHRQYAPCGRSFRACHVPERSISSTPDGRNGRSQWHTPGAPICQPRQQYRLLSGWMDIPSRK